MKKILISFALVAAAAVSAHAQLRVEALGNFASYDFSGGISNQTASSKFGFGLRGLYSLTPETSSAGVELGLGYLMDQAYNSVTDATITIHNVQIPVHAFYNWEVGNAIIKPCVGLYAGYAVSGKTVVGSGSISVTNDPFEGDTGLKKFDVGTEDEILLCFGRYAIGVGTQYSFLNLCKDSSVKVKYNSLYITLGYSF